MIDGTPRIEPGDSAIFFNFRPDRGRQLSRLLLDGGFDLTTMTRYSSELDCPVVFGEQRVPDTLAEVLARAGARQLHTAETEKYAHVTYFFNGGVEEAWPGEERILVPSRATCRATTSSPRCPRSRSPTGSAPRSGTATASRS